MIKVIYFYISIFLLVSLGEGGSKTTMTSPQTSTVSMLTQHTVGPINTTGTNEKPSDTESTTVIALNTMSTSLSLVETTRPNTTVNVSATVPVIVAIDTNSSTVSSSTAAPISSTTVETSSNVIKLTTAQSTESTGSTTPLTSSTPSDITTNQSSTHQPSNTGSATSTLAPASTTIAVNTTEVVEEDKPAATGLSPELTAVVGTGCGLVAIAFVLLAMKAVRTYKTFRFRRLHEVPMDDLDDFSGVYAEHTVPIRNLL